MSKYTDLDSLKVFMRANPLVGQNPNTTDDDALVQAISRAEDEIDCACGTAFESRTNTLELVPTTWATDGVLHLYLRYPIVAVSDVQVMDVHFGATTFTDQTITNCIVERPFDAGEMPHSGAWNALVWVNPAIDYRARGQLLVQASYTSGFTTIPPALQSLTNRYAYWFYMIREMPMGKVADLASQTITAPLANPADVGAETKGWRRIPL